jgi:hypothetical protein
VTPGAVQGDLVLHCGETTEGRYCATLVAVDVATTWTERQASSARSRKSVTLDPLALARDIQQTLDVLWKLADIRATPRAAARG